MNWIEKWRWKRSLRGCDYQRAAENIMRHFSGLLIPEDLSDRLDGFVNKPCFENAVSILEYDPELVAFFANRAEIFRSVAKQVKKAIRDQNQDWSRNGKLQSPEHREGEAGRRD